jgi:hypothetical protein
VTCEREEIAMAGKNIAVFGIYPHRASFEYGFRVLKEEGFRDTDISVLLQENPVRKDLKDAYYIVAVDSSQRRCLGFNDLVANSVAH